MKLLYDVIAFFRTEKVVSLYWIKDKAIKMAPFYFRDIL